MSASLFDIVGPVMIGPSSSHTAGALRIGRAAGLVCPHPVQATFYLHGSFATTYKGHGSDRALVAGLIGMNTDNPDIKNALDICSQQGIKIDFVPTDLGDVHPNTVKIVMTDQAGEQHSVTGSSVGGGEVKIVEIDGFETAITGRYPVVVTKHHDKVGVIKQVINLLAEGQVNIVTINLTRQQKGKMATAVIEMDEAVSPQLVQQMKQLPSIEDVLSIQAF